MAAGVVVVNLASCTVQLPQQHAEAYNVTTSVGIAQSELTSAVERSGPLDPSAPLEQNADALGVAVLDPAELSDGVNLIEVLDERSMAFLFRGPWESNGGGVWSGRGELYFCATATVAVVTRLEHLDCPPITDESSDLKQTELPGMPEPDRSGPPDQPLG